MKRIIAIKAPGKKSRWVNAPKRMKEILNDFTCGQYIAEVMEGIEGCYLKVKALRGDTVLVGESAMYVPKRGEKK